MYLATVKLGEKSSTTTQRNVPFTMETAIVPFLFLPHFECKDFRKVKWGNCIHPFVRKVILAKQVNMLPDCLETVKSYIECYEASGIDKLLRKGQNGTKKYEDPRYKEALFKILHAPPSS